MGVLGTFVMDLSFPLITVLPRVFTPIPNAPMVIFTARCFIKAFPVIEPDAVVIGSEVHLWVAIRCEPSACVLESLPKWVEPVKVEILKLRFVSEEEVPNIPNMGLDGFIIVEYNGVVALDDSHK